MKIVVLSLTLVHRICSSNGARPPFFECINHLQLFTHAKFPGLV
jgi:hypothetical protein